jgi:acetyl-CoA acetyltransferase family protein
MPKASTAFSRDIAVYDTTIGWRFVNQKIQNRYGTDSMPQTADNVTTDCGIARADQDAFAARSQARWANAQRLGIFANEIVPVTIPQGKAAPLIVDTDEHPRPETTMEKLSTLKGVNGPQLSVTAGNSSGINDGAAALLLATEEAASKHGLRPMARIVAMASAGVEPRVMGLGPIPATRKVLARTGLTVADMDLVELNEAFASQALATLRALGIPDDAEHVNPNGGAIALGHPLGMSGARLVLSAAYQLKRTGGRYALCTMCVGVGQGTAMVLAAV